MITARLFYVAGLVLAMAGGAAAQEGKPQRQRSNRDLITNEQTKDPRFKNAYEIVEALHSNWLRPRMTNGFGSSSADAAAMATSAGDTSAAARQLQQRVQSTPVAPIGEYAGVRVYLDGVQVGGVDELRSILATNVYEIRHFVGNDAQSRFGIGNDAGVIVVYTTPDASAK